MKNFIFYSFAMSLFLIGCEPTADSNSEDSTVIAINDSELEDADVKISNAYKASDLPDGNFKDYYPNEQLKVSGMVVSGVRVGQWVSYHTNGNKQSENEYEGGVLHGKTVAYYANGQIMYIGYYKGGNYEGDWLYYSKDGIHLKTVIYKDGKIVSSNLINDTIQ